MVAIYCRNRHKSREIPCAECAALLDYARRRLDNCPFQEIKPACNDCLVHCYSARMRERVKSVMRYAGPRMMLRHPWLALMHLIDGHRPVPKLVPTSPQSRAAPPAADPAREAESSDP